MPDFYWDVSVPVMLPCLSHVHLAVRVASWPPAGVCGPSRVCFVTAGTVFFGPGMFVTVMCVDVLWAPRFSVRVGVFGTGLSSAIRLRSAPCFCVCSLVFSSEFRLFPAVVQGSHWLLYGSLPSCSLAVLAEWLQEFLVDSFGFST